MPNIFKPVLYAEDTNIILSSDTISDLSELMNSEFKKLSSWLAINKLTLNIDKCIYILFNIRNIHSSNTLPIFLNEIPIKHVLNYKLLGVYIDEKLDWKQQYGYVTLKLCRVIGIIKKLNINLNLNNRIVICKSLFMSHLNYCSRIWGKLLLKQIHRRQFYMKWH